MRTYTVSTSRNCRASRWALKSQWDFAPVKSKSFSTRTKTPLAENHCPPSALLLKNRCFTANKAVENILMYSFFKSTLHIISAMMNACHQRCLAYYFMGRPQRVRWETATKHGLANKHTPVDAVGICKNNGTMRNQIMREGDV